MLEKALPAAARLSTRDYLITAVNLGIAYRVSGRLHDAQLVMSRALRVPGAGTLPEALSARSELAALEALLGRRKAAGALFYEVLAEQTSRMGPTSRATLSTLSSLIEFSMVWKRYEEAEKLTLRYLEDNAKARLPSHPSNAFGHYYLAILDARRKRYPEASEGLRRALEILEASVGRRSPSVAVVLNVFASLEIKRRRLEAALELSREAVSICEEALGPRHRETGIMLSTYAEIQSRLRYRDEARQNRAKAAAIAN